MKFFALVFLLLVLLSTPRVLSASFDYGAALTKTLLYFEAQRSGKLPLNQRVIWRGDSGLNDGKDVGLDLTGGYYDGGDNVKFGFPMAFTTTMLAMSVVDFKDELEAKNELSNALQAIKWATDYMIKAHPEPNVFYGEVGDGDSDHACWMRPEDMDTPRTSYKIEADHPGSDLAAETAAALAASSIAFNDTDPNYSKQLLTHAKQLFEFARYHHGLYHDSIPVAYSYYKSIIDEDELGWAAGWLFRATLDHSYMIFIDTLRGQGSTRSAFYWNDKYTGSQLLIARYLMFYGDKEVGNGTKFFKYKSCVDRFICNCLQRGSRNFKRTPGGSIWWFISWNPLQFTASASLLAVSYAKYLELAKLNIKCAYGPVAPADLIMFARAQVDYMLGANPKNFSYMLGFGENYPKKVSHRGASIVSIKNDSRHVTCHEGYKNWFNKKDPNPNVLEGALVGGPDENDEYDDVRSNIMRAEPTTVTTAPLVGVLAKLASME